MHHDATHPLLERVRTLAPRERFWYYLCARWDVTVQRAARKNVPPFTDDPILQTYKFTNVLRKMDRTSRWLEDHWYKGRSTHPMLGRAAAIARFIGNTDTLTAIGFPPQDKRAFTRWMLAAAAGMRALKANGHTVFTGAYIISAAGADKGTIKSDYVLHDVLDPVFRSGVLDHGPFSSVMELHAHLTTFNGWGHFMTQEVLMDLITFTPLCRADPDVNDYAYAGPGCLRGLRRVADLPKKFPVDQDTARELMKDLRAYVKAQYAQSSPVRTLPRRIVSGMSLHTIEFNLCEFDKYERALWNEGAPKARFTPSAVPLSLLP